MFYIPRNLKLSVVALALAACGITVQGQEIVGGRPTRTPISVLDSTRDQDGLIGAVRRVRTELTRLSNSSGQSVEGRRVLLETAAYDLRGRRIGHALYPLDDNPVIGQEEYKYDDKGNITEKVLRDEGGSVISTEVYTYEFDQVGNWTKMTTAVAVVEAGQISYEPTEVLHRALTYYFNGNVTPATTSAAAKSTASGDVAARKDDPAPAQMEPPKVAVNSSLPNIPPASQALSREALGEASNITTVSPGTDASLTQAATPDALIETDTEAPVLPPPTRAAQPLTSRPLIGKATRLPKPIYPETARALRLSGEVAIEVTVDIDGHVVAARPISGHQQLRAAAVEAARRSRFSPTLLAGKPVEVVGVIIYDFSYTPMGKQLLLAN